MRAVLAIEPVTAARVAEQSAKTLIILVVLVVGFRITGKRELSQLNLYDLVMLMALANAVQNAMTGGLGNLPIGLATSTTIVIVAWVITRGISRRPGAEHVLLGTPEILVMNGQVIHGRLRHAQLSADDLAQACRERGIESPKECKMIVLEIDGSLSIIPADTHGEHPSRRRPRRRRGRHPR